MKSNQHNTVLHGFHASLPIIEIKQSHMKSWILPKPVIQMEKHEKNNLPSKPCFRGITSMDNVSPGPGKYWEYLWWKVLKRQL